jgi:hypothetical protein
MMGALTWLVAPALAADKEASKQTIKAAGILFDFDRKANWLSVKADGEEEPVKYRIDPSDRKLAAALGSVFNACRVQLTYRTEDAGRTLVSIRRQILKASGTVTGTVVKVHNDFWIELKPRNGPADAFAPGANYNDRAFMAQLRALQPGDSVTIRYTTDFERHRIEALRKNASPGPRGSNPDGEGTRAKEKD